MAEYLCETCGKHETLTEKEAFEAGWDYPPFIGAWGVVSPRTCGECSIDTTAWWHLTLHGSDDLPERHRATIARIIAEGTDENDG